MHRRRPPFGLLTAAFLLAVGGGACDRQTVMDSDATAADPADVPRARVTIDVLRATHPEASNEGESCTTDRDCAAPLRCIDAGCEFPPAMTGTRTADTPTATLQGDRVADASYALELAVQPWEVTRGLMFRRTLADGFGMLFIFGREEPRSFWMRNTYVPLDMVFIRQDGVVDSVIEGAEPLTETPRRSQGPARFVLELNAGEVARIGLVAGSIVRFEGIEVRGGPSSSDP